MKVALSPFPSFVRSYPDLNYRIIHGIRYSQETYKRESYRDGKYMCCITRHEKGDFYGRITEYLNNESLNKRAYYFLCGNYEMIDEVFDLLIARGIDKIQIKTEGYF